MFVLSRKSQESVVVGGSDGLHRLLKVTVLAIEGANVRLGIEVDPDVPVRRSETREFLDADAGKIVNLNQKEPSSWMARSTW